MYLESDLTLEHAARLLALGSDEIANGATPVDMAATNRVDSSALSLMLAGRRRAAAAGQRIEFRNVPDSLISLAKLYGVGEFIQS